MMIMYDVPQILQNPELPNGCEITSLCELLRYYGLPADKCDLADHFLPRSEHWYGADPDRVYMGDPRLDDGSAQTGYYCFAQPLIQAAHAYLDKYKEAFPAARRLVPVDLTGAEEEDLVEALRSGSPFVFWASLHFEDIMFDPAPAWKLPDGSMHRPFHQLHCMVCKGMDDRNFYIADPLDYNTQADRKQFMKIFRQLGNRAMYLRPLP